MSRSTSLIAVGVILCLLLSSLAPLVLPGPTRAQPADSPWPMFGQNPQRTGQSPYTGPEAPGLKWSFATGGEVWSSPVVGADGTIYVGSNDHNLYAINPDGTQKWSFETGFLIQSAPAIGADGTIYVGSQDFHAINPDGTQKWTFETAGNILSSPAVVADGTIYVGSTRGRLYAINPDGTQKWSFYFPGSWIGDLYMFPNIKSFAIGSDGIVYVHAPFPNHGFYAIDPDGNEKWRVSIPFFVSTPAIGADGTVYVGSSGEEGKLYAIDSDGTQEWSFTTGGPVTESPAIGPDGTIYVASGDGKLYAINPDGTQKWTSIPDSGLIGGAPTIGSDGTVYVSSYVPPWPDDFRLAAINPDGTQKWSFTTGRPTHSSPAIGADGTIYVGSMDNSIYAITRNGVEPDVTTQAPTTITTDSAVLHGRVEHLGDFNTVDVSFQWWAEPETRSETASQTMNQPGPFSTQLTDLESNTTYHFRAQAVADGITIYGDEKSFTTVNGFLDNPPIGEGLESIADELLMVYVWRPATQSWDMYWPAAGIDTIGTLEVGTAYWILVDSDCTLKYGTRNWELFEGWHNIAWLPQ